eukprot:1161341-Pelagomonas_calceolata.AAC.13
MQKFPHNNPHKLKGLTCETPEGSWQHKKRQEFEDKNSRHSSIKTVQSTCGCQLEVLNTDIECVSKPLQTKKQLSRSTKIVQSTCRCQPEASLGWKLLAFTSPRVRWSSFVQSSNTSSSMHLPVAALHSTTAEGGMGLMSSFAKSLQCCSDTASRAEMTSSQRWLAA